MTPVFKPGDRVPAQVALPREEFWKTKQPLFRYTIACRGCGGTFSDDDKRRTLCGACDPAPAPSPDTPEPVPDVAEDRHHCGFPVGGGHLVSCPTILGDIVRSRTAGKSPVVDVAEDREGLRETIARAVYASYFASEADEDRDRDWSRWASDALSIADAILPIIDRHTAKAINHAVMAQDSALEVALRERDEAIEMKAREVLSVGLPENAKWLLASKDKWHACALAAEAALAAEQSAHAETKRERQAVITLLYSDAVFVGSDWVDFPNAEKGVWPALCAHTSSYGADAETVPPDQVIPLADLVERHGPGAVEGWVAFRRGADAPMKGNLAAAGRAALAELRARAALSDTQEKAG